MEITNNGLAGHPWDANPTPPRRDQVEICKDWIRRWVTPRQSINRNHSSYALKHAVEAEAGQYVSNGAFIQAAVELGYCYQRCRDQSPNACFNMNYDRVTDSICFHFGSRNKRMPFEASFKKMRQSTTA